MKDYIEKLNESYIFWRNVWFPMFLKRFKEALKMYILIWKTNPVFLIMLTFGLALLPLSTFVGMIIVTYSFAYIDGMATATLKLKGRI